MRKLTASVMLLMVACATAQTNAPVDNFTLVTNLWWNGYKTNVLQIAEQRLAANSNDLAGLILKLEYDIAFMNTTALSNDVNAIEQVACLHSEEAFNTVKPLFSFALTNILDFLAYGLNLSDEEILLERQKGFINAKPFQYEPVLNALHNDGLF